LIVQMVAGGPSLRVLDVAADETVAQRRQAKEEQDAMAETTAEEAAEAPEIIGDKLTKSYYLTACRPEKEIVEANKVVFKTTDEAEKAGFKLAKNCH
jgi:hypothetical protein